MESAQSARIVSWMMARAAAASQERQAPVGKPEAQRLVCFLPLDRDDEHFTRGDADGVGGEEHGFQLAGAGRDRSSVESGSPSSPSARKPNLPLSAMVAPTARPKLRMNGLRGSSPMLLLLSVCVIAEIQQPAQAARTPLVQRRGASAEERTCEKGPPANGRRPPIAILTNDQASSVFS